MTNQSKKSPSSHSPAYKIAGEAPGNVIHRLPPGAVNQIAAGEVIERPAAAIKEMVENSLDAGATRIEVEIIHGGKTLMSVTDNGCGMSPDDMQLAMERHATSKLTPSDEGQYDLTNIQTMGFRGEALPSIGAVARLDMISRTPDSPEAWQLSVHGGMTKGPSPAAFNGHGTKIEVRDLFYATPARLKFLKSDGAESTVIGDVLRRLAMARADVGFSLISGGRKIFHFTPRENNDLGRLARLGEIMGKGFSDNALAIEAERDGAKVSGFAGLPTFNRAMPDKQYLFVNGRPIRDKLVTGSVRAAYADFLARDRHPAVALFLSCPPDMVDVNVHPAKTEVRFRDAGSIRGLLIGALRHALGEAGHRAATTTSDYALGKMTPGQMGHIQSGPRFNRSIMPPNPFRPYGDDGARQGLLGEQNNPGGQHSTELAEEASRFSDMQSPAGRYEGEVTENNRNIDNNSDTEFPLGAARAQLHRTYIVSQTSDGLIIVDQHAAHERLVYEGMKAGLEAGEIARQGLLIPEIVELEAREVALIESHSEQFAQLGLVIERFGDDAVMVREVPAMLGTVDVKGLIADLVADLVQFGEGLVLKERLEEVCSSMACHGSIRAGRAMSAPEMNNLLREMEATPHSGQCNHGRPTYVELKLADIERLFGRR